MDARLSRGRVTAEMAVASLVVPQAYRITPRGLVALEERPSRARHDPPDTSMYVVWTGVSVTVAGHVHGPTKSPFVRLVQLRVGDVTRKLAVFGDRVWERSILAGGLVPSEPLPFDRLELSVARAFGGGFDVPPGLLELPGSRLPHPGYRADHPLNPGGVGFYPDERAAAGGRLPNFERPEALVQRWSDSPEPVAFSPCRDLVGWRIRGLAHQHMDDHLARGGTRANLPRPLPSFRMFHHAPPDLIFDAVPVGTNLEVDGLAEGPLRFATPGCLARVEVETASAAAPTTDVVTRLRAVHVDADRALCLVVHALSFKYDPRRAPKGVRVARTNGAPS